MPSAELTSLDQLIAHLRAHGDWAYLVLFVGAFFETLIPFSLAVLGEVFFLAGAVLSGVGALELWGVMGVLYAGGILGDNASYWIGRRYGPTLFDRLSGWPLIGRPLRNANYQNGVAFFQRRGALAVFIARLSGPLSWVMPALAGTFRLNYGTFFVFNTLGVLVGIGQFLVVGYLFGRHLETILVWMDRYGLVITAGIMVALIVVIRHRLANSRAA